MKIIWVITELVIWGMGYYRVDRRGWPNKGEMNYVYAARHVTSLNETNQSVDITRATERA